jgi:membrane AbrB-like protein
MDSFEKPPEPALLATMPRPLQWLLLALLSVLLATLLELGHLPAALLIGPMIAGIAVGTNGAAIRVPKALYALSQGVVGVLIAASISLTIFSSFLADWPLFLLAVIATLVASSVLGWLISRWRVLPGSTAVWGSSPGAANAMVLMAEAFGADARLVAFMQYLRVIIVSLTAAMVARLWVDTSGVVAAPIVWFPPIDAPAFAATVAVVFVGSFAGRLLRLPSPFFMGVFLVATALHLGLDVDFQLPNWLLAVSYALIGWSIGLNFTRAILLHAMKALPQIVGSIVVLIAFCGALAWVLVEATGVDPLTAYLATSPGGMDAVAIIAAASRDVDISFIMALQLARFLMVLLFGPVIARLVARLVRE